MEERTGIASARADFECHTMLDSGLPRVVTKADALRPRVYDLLAEDLEDPKAQARLVAGTTRYLATSTGEPLLRGGGKGDRHRKGPA